MKHLFPLVLLLAACSTQKSSSVARSRPESVQAQLAKLRWDAVTDPAQWITSYKVHEQFYDGHTIFPWTIRATVTVPSCDVVAQKGLHKWYITSISQFGESGPSAIARSGNL